MHASSFSVLSFIRSKPVGKVRRRVQDLRVPSSSYVDFLASRPTLDLSHNESERLAVDSLLSQGLEEYQEVLNMEGEVDFLSELDKKYILRNATNVHSGASDGDDEDLASLSTESPSWRAAASTDDESLASVFAGVKLDPDQEEPSAEVYLQSENTAAGMKDLVREFIRKAATAVVVVTDSFSDVELLFDLLEASRKRNVSVHLLLDRLHLSVFTCTWQELKLSSKHFPKLSVRSVPGRTYCAKTGRKLPGRLCENFIITDWTKVLTGSYSLSWLSWQVHRSLAVLLKGGAVSPFRQEFLRLFSRSNPVPGFVTLPHAAPNSTRGVVISESKQDRIYCWGWTEEGRTLDLQDTQTKAKVSASLSKAQSSEFQTDQTVHSTQHVHRTRTHLEAQEENQRQTWIQSRPNHPGQHFPVIPSQLSALGVTPAAGRTAQELNPLFSASPGLTNSASQHRTPYQTVRYQSTVTTGQSPGGADHHTGLFSQRRTMYPGIAVNTSMTRGQLNYKVSLLSHHPSGAPPPPPQEKPGPLWTFTPTKRHPCGQENMGSSLRTRNQDQNFNPFRPVLQSPPPSESPRSPPPSSATGTRLRLQHFSPSPGTNAHMSLQVTSPPNPNWTAPIHTRTPVDHHRSFLTTYGTPFYSGITTPLRNINSTTYRHPGSDPKRTRT